MQNGGGWIGVDLDGTLAEYDGWKGPTHIGDPVPMMVERVQQWLARGIEVRVFTARASVLDTAEKNSIIEAIGIWTFKHIGTSLAVTCVKDYAMIELWDDRCVQVIPNTGIAVEAQPAVLSDVEIEKKAILVYEETRRHGTIITSEPWKPIADALRSSALPALDTRSE